MVSFAYAEHDLLILPSSAGLHCQRMCLSCHNSRSASVFGQDFPQAENDVRSKWFSLRTFIMLPRYKP